MNLSHDSKDYLKLNGFLPLAIGEELPGARFLKRKGRGIISEVYNKIP
jgi:hypothetical protein